MQPRGARANGLQAAAAVAIQLSDARSRLGRLKQVARESSCSVLESKIGSIGIHGGGFLKASVCAFSSAIPSTDGGGKEKKNKKEEEGSCQVTYVLGLFFLRLDTKGGAIISFKTQNLCR